MRQIEICEKLRGWILKIKALKNLHKVEGMITKVSDDKSKGKRPTVSSLECIISNAYSVEVVKKL